MVLSSEGSGRPERSELPQAFHRYFWSLCVGASLVLGATTAVMTGDSIDYAADVAASTDTFRATLFEPGHLVWRPIGALLLRATSAPPSETSAERTVRAQRMLTRASEASALLAALSFFGVVCRFVGAGWIAVTASLLLVSGAAFLNYAHSGTPYVPGLAFLCVAMWLGWRTTTRLLHAALASLALAFSVLLWLPYLLVVPAALAGIGVFSGGSRKSTVARVAVVLSACAAVGVVSYSVAAWRNGIISPAGFHTWLLESSHGISAPGVGRAGVGFLRNFLSVGTDVREVKRFLLHDPLNRVSELQLAALWIWPKAVLLVIGLGVAALLAWRAQAAPLLAVTALAAAPVALALAVAWCWWRPERFLPLYPFRGDRGCSARS